MQRKRTDSHRVVLKVGELELPSGTYSFRWTDILKKRHAVYAKTLQDLREKEKSIARDTLDGLRAEDEANGIIGGPEVEIFFSLRPFL